MLKSPKVFGIGFHKTGTLSLGNALTMLGYRVCGPAGVFDPDIARKLPGLAIEAARQFDAFHDNPWPLLFRELDQAFPGSRFVLTLRDEDAWWRSALTYFGPETTPMRELIYGPGSPVGNEEVYRQRFRAHNRAVLEHFARRPRDLCVMDITAGDGWDKLCAFLDVPVPPAAFPHRNKAEGQGGSG
jgi:hypothetical protein